MNRDLYEKYNFLYEYGSSIIKNEAAEYLGINTDELRASLLKNPEVEYWIDCLYNFMEKPQVHNAADTCFENAMHKLLSYGIKETDDNRIYEVNKFILECFEVNIDNQNFFNSINTTILASWLACMGHTEAIIIDILRERVEKIYSAVKDKDYDIYADPKGFPTIPKARAMHPLVKPEFYKNNIWRLPTIHDIFAFAHLPEILRDDKEIQKKIDTIIDYIFDDRYQQFYIGYGLMLVPPRNYYSMGWSVHLCRYFEEETFERYGFVWQMALMAKFNKARETDWFKNNLEYLKSFEDNGVYNLPVSYLKEEKNRYYVLGFHMGLGEDKKKKISNTLVSTAWILRIITGSRC